MKNVRFRVCFNELRSCCAALAISLNPFTLGQNYWIFDKGIGEIKNHKILDLDIIVTYFKKQDMTDMIYSFP